MAAILTTKSGNEYIGFNSYQTHPLAKRFSKNGKTICLHAEIDAIRRAISRRDDLRGSSLVVARVLRNGLPALAMPCRGCQSAIVAFGIEDVVWTP